MKLVFKARLFSLVAAALLVIAAVSGMPGARDGELHLAGDYYFTHSGGFQNSITEERDGLSEFVIPMKVEEFIVHGRGIFVTRRPVVRQEAGNNRWNFRLADTCEYYRINVAAGKVYGPFTLAEVKNQADWAFLKGSRQNRDFGPTICKLAAAFK